MRNQIDGIRDVHAVRNAAEYEAAQAQAIAKLQRRGRTVAIHTSDLPVIAYINDNRWVIDCHCGAGNATDPAWDVARCFNCGAVHTQVQFPSAKDRQQIEKALLERPHSGTRNWYPHETAEGLEAENITHGLKKVNVG